MNFLGLEITRKAPQIKLQGTDFELRTIKTAAASLKISPAKASAGFWEASQELPAKQPPRYSDASLSGRAIQSDPLGDWYLSLPDKIPPKQISQILRQALAGNIWQQSQLTRLMCDSWPMFSKTQFELRAAIASSKYVVHPYTVPGKKPTNSAKEKADLVERCLNNFDVDRFADEDGMNGMIFDLGDAILNGISIVELIWNEYAIAPNGGKESNVRASAWVHPRNIAFTADGRYGVATAAESGEMSFSNQVRGDMMNDPDKFLVAKFKSKSGSPLGAGWMRKLAWYWVMIVYGRDFAMNYAQKYGNPFFDLAYETGSFDQKELDELERLAKRAQNQGYFVHPSTSKLEVGKEHGMSGDNAQLALMSLADYQCQMLMLGQTLTSSAPDKGGSRAQGDVHENVRQERLEEHAKWIARILTEQFADSVLRVNYGIDYLRNPERPTVEANFNRPMSATEQADYLQKTASNRTPLIAAEEYKLLGKQMPEPGDTVISAGEVIIFEEPLTPTEKKEKDFDTQLEQQEAMNGLEGWQPGQVAATRKLIAAASEQDKIELENLVTAAERAPHLNGEVIAIKSKLQQLIIKKRK